MNPYLNPQNPTFISLESIEIASPRRADWNKMVGVDGEADDRARHCRSCDKNVYNLSAMTRAEAERLLLHHEGNLCVQLHRRADGTVITSDCPVGISPVRKPAKWLNGAFGAAIAAVLAVFGVQNSWAGPPKPHVTAGAPMMVMGEAPAAVRGRFRVVMGKPVPLKAPAKVKSKHHAKRASRTKSNVANR